MPKLKDVTRYVRSKNAGPFWVTVDIFFADEEAFYRYRSCDSISTAALAKLLGASHEHVHRFEIDSLRAIKFSYARAQPQGGILERDMHSGQQYVSLLDIDVK